MNDQGQAMVREELIERAVCLLAKLASFLDGSPSNSDRAEVAASNPSRFGRINCSERSLEGPNALTLTMAFRTVSMMLDRFVGSSPYRSAFSGEPVLATTSER